MAIKLEHVEDTASSGSAGRQSSSYFGTGPSSNAIAKISASSSTRSGRKDSARHAKRRRAKSWLEPGMPCEMRSYLPPRSPSRSASPIPHQLRNPPEVTSRRLPPTPPDPRAVIVTPLEEDTAENPSKPSGMLSRARRIAEGKVFIRACSWQTIHRNLYESMRAVVVWKNNDRLHSVGFLTERTDDHFLVLHPPVAHIPRRVDDRPNIVRDILFLSVFVVKGDSVRSQGFQGCSNIHFRTTHGTD